MPSGGYGTTQLDPWNICADVSAGIALMGAIKNKSATTRIVPGSWVDTYFLNPKTNYQSSFLNQDMAISDINGNEPYCAPVGSNGFCQNTGYTCNVDSSENVSKQETC